MLIRLHGCKGWSAFSVSGKFRPKLGPGRSGSLFRIFIQYHHTHKLWWQATTTAFYFSNLKAIVCSVGAEVYSD